MALQISFSLCYVWQMLVSQLVRDTRLWLRLRMCFGILLVMVCDDEIEEPSPFFFLSLQHYVVVVDYSTTCKLTIAVRLVVRIHPTMSQSTPSRPFLSVVIGIKSIQVSIFFDWLTARYSLSTRVFPASATEVQATLLDLCIPSSIERLWIRSILPVHLSEPHVSKFVVCCGLRGYCLDLLCSY